MRKQRGFTLIELLVVIAIIGILATLVIVQLSGAQTRARNSNAKSDVTEMGKAVETYKSSANNGQGSDLVMNSTAVTGGAAGDTMTGTTAAGAWTNIFNSATSGYTVRVSKSPSASHIYGYAADLTTNPGNWSTGVLSGNYCVGTSVTSGTAGVTDTAFYVLNGTSVSKPSGTGVTYANAAAACS